MFVLAVSLGLEFAFIEASQPIRTTKTILLKPLNGRLKSIGFFQTTGGN